MKLIEIITTKKNGYAIGFKKYGRAGINLFESFSRCSYKENLGLENAFRTGNIRWINDIEIYPEGIIAVRNANSSGTIFAVQDITLDTKIIDERASVVIISKEDFDETFTIIKNLTVERLAVTNAPCIKQKALNTKNKIVMDDFSVKLRQMISIYGKEIFYNDKFKAILLDFMTGEHKRETENLLNLLKQENHNDELERKYNLDIY